MPRMDINSGFIAIAVILVAIALVSLWSGIRDIQSARKMTFFRLRRQRIASGWRLFGLALVLGVLAITLPVFGEPVAYQYFPPSPTITLTPSITLIPTITLTPSITVTPSITTHTSAERDLYSHFYAIFAAACVGFISKQYYSQSTGSIFFYSIHHQRE